MTDNAYTRRVFLQRSLAMVSATGTLPLFLQRSAFAIDDPFAYRQTASRPGVPEDRILVVVQLGGGNDGLNTVVPYGNGRYYDLRPGLAIPAPGQGGAGRNAALALDGQRGLGLHPSLTGLKDLLDDGVASIVQGVGYPNPNRSHFASMDVW
ncbi:MAG: hypothetical protein MI802_08860, partial [Desulfobacterales bacterium]|nr:hypothetical protein [Desulfobacterales bacterium]